MLDERGWRPAHLIAQHALNEIYKWLLVRQFEKVRMRMPMTKVATFITIILSILELVAIIEWSWD